MLLTDIASAHEADVLDRCCVDRFKSLGLGLGRGDLAVRVVREGRCSGENSWGAG